MTLGSTAYSMPSAAVHPPSRSLEELETTPTLQEGIAGAMRC